MKKRNRKQSKKSLYIALSSVLLVAGLSAVFFVWNNPNSESSQNNSDSTIIKPEPTDEVVPDQLPNDIKQTDPNKPSDAPIDPTPTDSTIDFTTEQNESSNIVVKTYLKNIGSGNCQLKITDSAGNTFEESAEVLYQPNNSTCLGFEILREKVSAGEAKVQLSVTSNDNAYESEIKTITVR